MKIDVETRSFIIRLIGGRVDVMEALFSLYVSKERMPKITLGRGRDPDIESEYACCDIGGYADDTLGYEGLITTLMKVCAECEVLCHLLSEPTVITESVHMPDAEDMLILEDGSEYYRIRECVSWVDPDTVGSLDEFIDAVRSQENDAQRTNVNDDWLEEFYTSDGGFYLRWSIARNAEKEWRLYTPEDIREMDIRR